jgi:hypothetical protein
VKIQRKDFVSKKDFLCRYPARGQHLADLAVVSEQWRAPAPRCEDSAARWLRSRRHEGTTAAPAEVARWLGCITIPPIVTVDQTHRPEKTLRGANIGLSEGNSETSLSAKAVGVPPQAAIA